jgi:hypothetical protein
MDESLVLLSFMLDLPVTDVLYLDSKVAGNYILLPKEKKCRQIGHKRELFPSTVQFLQSERWKEVSKIDRIDLTIDDVIRRDVFNVRMQEFLTAKAVIHGSCSIVTGCTADGRRTNKNDRSVCYQGDVGCGHECVDSLFPFE